MIEQIRQKASGLFSGGEDRGVSPVIGVILMVAITVILAAVIGAFVLGLGDDLGNSSGPQAQLSITEEGTNLVITHNGGDDIEGAALNGDGASGASTTEEGSADNFSLTAGESITFTGHAGDGSVNVVVGDTIVASTEI